MKAQFSQDHIPPVPVQPPHFQLQVAERAGRVLAPEDAKKAESDRESQHGSGRGTLAAQAQDPATTEQHLEAQRTQSRLEGAQATLHQLDDLLRGLIEGVSASGYGPQSTRQNQRLLKGAVIIGREILSNAAESDVVFRLNTADLHSHSRPVAGREAAKAYGEAGAFTQNKVQEPPLIGQTRRLIHHHITGPHGMFAALQNQSQNGPFSTDRVKRVLNDAKTTVEGIRTVVARFQAQDYEKARPVDRPA